MAKATAKAAKAAETRSTETASAESERALGTWVARALPAATLVASIAVGMATSLGPALLVLASGALLGTIALLWASVRTLGGDAPLPRDLEALAARMGDVDDLAERKQRILRALKDLEHEHDVGKIDDDDYADIAADYREQAKEVMREMDADLAPLRDRAEEIARQHLKKRGIEVKEEEQVEEDEGDDESSATAPDRVVCKDCSTSNEHDAAFCKKCGATLGAKKEDRKPEETDASS